MRCHTPQKQQIWCRKRSRKKPSQSRRAWVWCSYSQCFVSPRSAVNLLAREREREREGLPKVGFPFPLQVSDIALPMFRINSRVYSYSYSYLYVYSYLYLYLAFFFFPLWGLLTGLHSSPEVRDRKSSHVISPPKGGI